METKHTVGPWKDSGQGNGDIRIHAGTPATWIAECHWEGNPSLSNDRREEFEANAKLIAAAPEMLHRLETALHALQCFKRTGTIELVDVYIDDITRTIAKATHP